MKRPFLCGAYHSSPMTRETEEAFCRSRGAPVSGSKLEDAAQQRCLSSSWTRSPAGSRLSDTSVCGSMELWALSWMDWEGIGDLGRDKIGSARFGTARGWAADLWAALPHNEFRAARRRYKMALEEHRVAKAQNSAAIQQFDAELVRASGGDLEGYLEGWAQYEALLEGPDESEDPKVCQQQRRAEERYKVTLKGFYVSCGLLAILLVGRLLAPYSMRPFLVYANVILLLLFWVVPVWMRRRQRQAPHAARLR